MLAMILAASFMTATPAPAMTTAELLDRVRAKHPELFKAPPVEAWPQGLPRLVKVPTEGKCFDTGGNELGAGHWIAAERGAVVAKRLRRLEVYPGTVQVQLDELVGAISGTSICAAAGDGSTGVSMAENPEPAGHSTWSLIQWSVGSFLGGAVLAGTAVLLLTR